MYLEELTKLSFSKKNPAQIRYYEFLLLTFNQAGIFTVKDLLKNIVHLHEIPATQLICFSDREIDVLIQFASEWLHYQLPLKGETLNNIEYSFFTFTPQMTKTI